MWRQLERVVNFPPSEVCFTESQQQSVNKHNAIILEESSACYFHQLLSSVQSKNLRVLAGLKINASLFCQSDE